MVRIKQQGNFNVRYWIICPNVTLFYYSKMFLHILRMDILAKLKLKEPAVIDNVYVIFDYNDFMYITD
jgi:hypothetical protein